MYILFGLYLQSVASCDLALHEYEAALSNLESAEREASGKHDNANVLLTHKRAKHVVFRFLLEICIQRSADTAIKAMMIVLTSVCNTCRAIFAVLYRCCRRVQADEVACNPGLGGEEGMEFRAFEGRGMCSGCRACSVLRL